MASKKPASGPAHRHGKRRRSEPAKREASPASEPASRLIDAMVKDYGGWKGETMSKLRALIIQADPSMVEEVKWRKPSNPAGVPVWSHDGIVCTGNFLKNAVRITFANGARLDGKTKLYNAALEGNSMRAVDFFEGDEVDAGAFKDLVRAAVALNQKGK